MNTTDNHSLDFGRALPFSHLLITSPDSLPLALTEILTQIAVSLRSLNDGKWRHCGRDKIR